MIRKKLNFVIINKFSIFVRNLLTRLCYGYEKTIKKIRAIYNYIDFNC